MENPASEVKRNPAVQFLGRVGMVFYGAVHVLIAWLAVLVLFGEPAKTDSKGALAEVAKTGTWLLWALAAGLALFVVWQLAEAIAGYTWVANRRKRLSRRIGAVARSITATVIAIAAVRYAVGTGAPDTTGEQQALTARVLAMPLGQWLVAAVAVGILVTAFVVFRKGVTRSFEDDLDLATLPDGSRRWVERVGQVGWIGKGLAYGVIAVLVGTAAVTADPSESGGMDKALHELAGRPHGVALLALIAVGLAAFGVFCLVAARAHRE